MGSAVPDRVTAKVPELVMLAGLTDRNAGTVMPTEVTEPAPVPAPIALRKVAASKADTVLSALNRGKVTAEGLARVNILPPTVVAPIAVRKVAASSVETLLSALNRGKVMADGLARVNRLPPTMVAPRLVRALPALIAPVPPLATLRVPARVTAPCVPVDGVRPVVPALKEVTALPESAAHEGAAPVFPMRT